MLVLLEDAHWIDPSTQELFDLAVERLRELPVLLLVTFRPEYRCPWAGRGHVTALSLGRLGRQQAAALAGRLAGERDLPERPRGADRGQGRRRAAVRRGADQGGAGGRRSPRPTPPSLAIPTTLHDSLMARLDRLARVKDVAQAASVIGREFGRGLLAAVADLPEAALDAGAWRS